MSPAISASRLALAPGQRKAEAGFGRRLQCAGPLEHPAGTPAPPRPHQRDRELGGEDFVIGEPLARRGRRREIGLALRRVRGGDRLVPTRPPAALQHSAGSSHSGSSGARSSAAGDGARHDPRRQAGGQRVDRLDRPDAVGLLGRDDVVGMGDLRHAVVVVDPAADHPLRADRQQPLQIVALHVEIDEHQGAGRIADKHPIGSASVAGLMALYLGLDSDDGIGGPIAGMERTDRGRCAAVDQPRRQVPQEIDDIGPGRTLDEAAKLRPDAGQHRHRREQPVERSGAHG